MLADPSTRSATLAGRGSRLTRSTTGLARTRRRTKKDRVRSVTKSARERPSSGGVVDRVPNQARARAPGRSRSGQKLAKLQCSMATSGNLRSSLPLRRPARPPQWTPCAYPRASAGAPEVAGACGVPERQGRSTRERGRSEVTLAAAAGRQRSLVALAAGRELFAPGALLCLRRPALEGRERLVHALVGVDDVAEAQEI